MTEVSNGGHISTPYVLLNRLWCRVFGHQWYRHEGGHVHAGDDWQGEWRHGHPWTRGVRVCDRCDRSESL